MVSEQPAAPARRENVFTHKIGPLPMWAWVAIVAAALVAWRLYSNKSSSQNQPTTTPSTPADQVPQFVNQTYVTTTAPASPTTPAPAPAPGRGPGSGPGAGEWWNLPGGWVPLPNTPPTNPGPVVQFPPPTGLRVTGTGKNSVSLLWTTVPSGTRYPTSYTVAIYDRRGKIASQTTVNTPDTTGGQGTATVTGLQPKSSYHANVWANGGTTAPRHASVAFNTTS